MSDNLPPGCSQGEINRIYDRMSERLSHKELAEYWAEYCGEEPTDIEEADFWEWLEEQLEEKGKEEPEHD